MIALQSACSSTLCLHPANYCRPFSFSLKSSFTFFFLSQNSTGLIISCWSRGNPLRVCETNNISRLKSSQAQVGIQVGLFFLSFLNSQYSILAAISSMETGNIWGGNTSRLASGWESKRFICQTACSTPGGIISKWNTCLLKRNNGSSNSFFQRYNEGFELYFISRIVPLRSPTAAPLTYSNRRAKSGCGSERSCFFFVFLFFPFNRTPLAGEQWRIINGRPLRRTMAVITLLVRGAFQEASTRSRNELQVALRVRDSTRPGK